MTFRKSWRQVLVIIPVFMSVMLLWSGKGFSSTGVRFIVPLEAAAFSPEATVKVVLWNAQQLALSKRTAACSVSYDMRAKTEQVRCPDGSVYEKPEPEEFLFSVEELDGSIEVASRSVRIGRRYRLRVSGLSSDGCNTTSAAVDGKAGSGVVRLKKLTWRTTNLGCPGK